MDLLPGVPLPLALVALALLDSLSIGTLLVPLFLLLRPGRVRAGRMLLYLATIAVFYLAVGALFLLGLINVVDVARDVLASPVGQWGRLLAGVGLIATAFLIPSHDRAGAERVATGVDGRSPVAPPAGTGTAETAPPGRLSRWRERLLDPATAPSTVMAVAAGAGVVELATMLPYLLAMGLLADSDLPAGVQAASLAGYCAVMVVPATVLLLLRMVAARLVERPLQRLAGWLQRTAAENTAWILGIVGFLVARSAASELGLFDLLG